MIQFNLLPDVKLEYIRARKLKHTAIALSVIVTAVALSLLIVLFVSVALLQKKHLNDVSKDIATSSKKLAVTPDLDKILTIQNQLNSLTELHDQKSVASRLPKYIQQVTPAQAAITTFDIDLETQTINITGNADSLNTVNKFVDTLKFTDYKAGDQQARAFSDVVLTAFARNKEGASYTIDLKFDKQIFSGAGEVALVVPSIITTRSETEKPTDLFKVPTNGSQN